MVVMTAMEAQAKALPTCAEEVRAANSFISQQGLPKINDEAGLVDLIRYINKTKRLPPQYITSDEAKRAGWSGKGENSLWGVARTNRKLIGGDKVSHRALQANKLWRSADIDVVKGYRSTKRLIYSPNSQAIYISPDKLEHLLELSPCR